MPSDGSIEYLVCLDVGHDWVMATAWRSDQAMTWMMCCQRCGEFDEFGTDTAQSDQIWSLLVKEPNL